jgi:hypothetical protein
VNTNTFFVPDRANLSPSSILLTEELPAALEVSSDNAMFEGLTKKQILDASAGATPATKDLANLSSIADAYADANRQFEPRLRLSNVTDPVVPGRQILGGLDGPSEYFQKIAPGVNVAPIDPSLPVVAQITNAVAAGEQSFWKTIRSLATTAADKLNSYLGAFFAKTNAAFEKSVNTLADAILKAAQTSSEAIDFATTTVAETWKKALEVASKLSNGAEAAGEAVVRNLARWQNAFFDAIPNYFDGLPEQLVKTGQSVLEHYKQAWNDIAGLIVYDGNPARYAFKLTGAVAGALLAVLDGVAEYKKTGGFTPEFFAWAAKTVAITAVAIPVVGALANVAIASSPFWGTAGVVALLGVGFYFGVRSVASNLVEAFSDQTDSVIYQSASTVLDYMKKFEDTAASYLKEAASHLPSAEQAKELLAGLTNIAIDSFQIVGAGAAGFTYNEANAWLWGLDNAVLLGGDKNDWLIHSGYGSAYAGDGDDVLLGLFPKVVHPGEKIGPAPAQGQQDTRQVAQAELTLTLDGGSGNDWVIVFGGEKATTVGGLGRDLIYNHSKNGVIWGDVENSILDPSTGQRYYFDTQTDANGQQSQQKTYIADDATNADNFVWTPDTTVMDAQHHDILTFFGIPLVGGDSSGGIALSTQALGLVGIAIGAAQDFKSPIDTIYFDEILPFITYAFKVNSEGHLDLYVGNVFSKIFSGVGATANNPDAGTMVIKNFDLVGSYFGFDLLDKTGKGTLGMVFKKANPIIDILARLPETAITFALEGGGPLVDEAFTAAAAATRFAKALSWYVGGDPLILDLTGQGLETTSLQGSPVHFDLNNDFFAERTGWLGADDGFLVYDKNGNGVIDDASEMFGTFTGSGFADLAQYDDNHDGVIDASDAIWSQLLVWQDLNQDGVSQADELFTLDDEGIASISLESTATDGQTVEGATLRAFSSFTRTDGSVSTVYEAVFATDQTDTVYRGESGLASWQQNITLDMKGFGRVTNLSAAIANDQGLAALATSTAVAMTTPDLATLVQQIGPLLSAWGETQNLTRELDPVLVSADGTTLLDQAVYVEDAQGGYWTLASGGPVLDGDGAVIARKPPPTARNGSCNKSGRRFRGRPRCSSAPTRPIWCRSSTVAP